MSELSRRGFIGALGSLMAAPAIVRAESLMKIWVPKSDLILPVAVPVEFSVSGRISSSYTADWPSSKEEVVEYVWYHSDKEMTRTKDPRINFENPPVGVLMGVMVAKTRAGYPHNLAVKIR